MESILAPKNLIILIKQLYERPWAFTIKHIVDTIIAVLQ